MKTIDLIRGALTMGDKVTSKFADDLRDAPLTRVVTPHGNHPLWIMGHLAFIEGAISQVMFGESNPAGAWEPLFGMGSTPTDNAADYPSYDEVLKTYRDLREKNVAKLEEVGEDGLDAAPKAVPPGFENEMRTIGQTYLTIAMHQMLHAGQLTDVRRAAGRKPFV